MLAQAFQDFLNWLLHYVEAFALPLLNKVRWDGADAMQFTHWGADAVCFLYP